MMDSQVTLMTLASFFCRVLDSLLHENDLFEVLNQARYYYAEFAANLSSMMPESSQDFSSGMNSPDIVNPSRQKLNPKSLHNFEVSQTPLNYLVDVFLHMAELFVIHSNKQSDDPDIPPCCCDSLKQHFSLPTS